MVSDELQLLMAWKHFLLLFRPLGKSCRETRSSEDVEKFDFEEIRSNDKNMYLVYSSETCQKYVHMDSRRSMLKRVPLKLCYSPKGYAPFLRFKWTEVKLEIIPRYSWLIRTAIASIVPICNAAMKSLYSSDSKKDLLVFIRFPVRNCILKEKVAIFCWKKSSFLILPSILRWIRAQYQLTNKILSKQNPILAIFVSTHRIKLQPWRLRWTQPHPLPPKR